MMNKRAKTTNRKKKSLKSKHYSYSSHAEKQNSFLIIAGGGLVVILMFFFLMGNKTQVNNLRNSINNQAEAQNVVKENHYIEIGNSAFDPDILTISEGETVVFTNRDSASHKVVDDKGNFETVLLNEGESDTITFDKKGVYSYHDASNISLRGTVIVE